MTDESTDLIDVTKINAIDVFQGDGLGSVIETVRQAVANFEPDVSTRDGRKEIASMAAKVAKSKTFLEAQGKAMVDPMKEISGAIDARRKTLKDTFDEIRDEVRKPLNEWEAAEEERVADHADNIKEIVGAGDAALTTWDTFSPILMIERRQEIEAERSREWEEFADEANQAIDTAVAKLTTGIEKREVFDAEKAETERLRKESEERAAEDARLAEEKRQAERDAKIKADAAAAAEKSEAEAIERAEAAERRAEAAKETADREAKERLDAQQRATDQAERERAADQKHRSNIAAWAIGDLVVQGLSENDAGLAVEVISDGLVRNVKITY